MWQDGISEQSAQFLTLADSLTLVDGVSEQLSFNLSLADSVTLVDGLSAQLGLTFAVSDSLSFVDGASEQSAATLAPGESLVFVDGVSSFSVGAVALAESLVLSDTASSYLRGPGRWQDFIAEQLGAPGPGSATNDSFSLVDAIALASGTRKMLGDTMGITTSAFYAPVNPPELPRVYLDTTYAVPTGSAISVASGGSLQTAINAAVAGDVIELEAGAVWTGNYTLPNKTGNAWVTIRTATIDANLPAPGTRITPASVALLAKIQSNNAGPALATNANAHHYRFIGLEIGVQAGTALNYGLLFLGDSTFAQTAANTPHDLIVDRCYVHGNATGDLIRGIALNSGRTAVIDSYVSNCHGVGFDTQAVCGWNGPGPFKIVNNYLEGAGENFMIGGADPTITGLIGADIEFRNNHLYKPLSWKIDHPSYAGIHWSVKNIFELKNAQRVLVDGNLFENNWADAQDGFAIVLKVQNQDGGAPWTFTGDVTYTNNTLIHSGGGINLLGRDPYQISTLMDRFLFRNNLFIDINGVSWGNTHGRLFQIQETSNVTFDHNTHFNDGIVLLPYGGNPPSAPSTSTNFVWINNIGPHNLYGVLGDSFGTGNATINAYLPGCIFTNNILSGGNSAVYPSGNYFPSTLDPGVGFVNYPGGDYNLAPASPYNNAGTDGLDLGWLSSAPVAQPGQTDAFAFNQAAGGGAGLMLGISDALTLLDGPLPGVVYRPALVDTFTLTESLTASAINARVLADALSLSDSTSTSVVVPGAATIYRAGRWEVT